MAVDMTEIAKAVDRIRKFFRRRPDQSLAGFCKRADLHRNTLYGMQFAAWNPTRDTLERCLKLIDQIEAEEVRAKAKRTPKRGAVAPQAA